MKFVAGSSYKSVLSEITCEKCSVHQTGEGRFIYREGEGFDGRQRIGRLPPERLLVAIETAGEEIKKGRE